MSALPTISESRPAAISRREVTLAAKPVSLAARIYVPEAGGKSPVLVMHLHGGTFNDGSLDTGEAVAAMLARSGAAVVSVEYPLAPEHRFPDVLEAAFGGLEAVYKNRGRWAVKHAPLYVAGEEAGGNLAAALAMMARDRQGPPLAGQILLSPMLDACLGTYSFRAADAGPVGCRWADGWHDYLGSPDKAAHPYAAPLGAARLAGLAPALLITAEDDLMRDETADYGRRLQEAGVFVRSHLQPAPSNWPEAYAEGPKEGSCLCLARDHVSKFFEATAPS
jgi:acetyl esterase/lipase